MTDYPYPTWWVLDLDQLTDTTASFRWEREAQSATLSRDDWVSAGRPTRIYITDTEPCPGCTHHACVNTTGTQTGPPQASE